MNIHLHVAQYEKQTNKQCLKCLEPFKQTNKPKQRACRATDRAAIDRRKQKGERACILIEVRLWVSSNYTR